MKRNIFLLIFLIFFEFVYSQSDITKKYYSDKYCTKESSEQKGKYLKVSRKINDSITQIETIRVKKNIILNRINMLKNHPYGICQYYNENGELDYESDYTFTLKYGEFRPDGYFEIDYKSKIIKKDTSGLFEVPLIAGSNNDIFQYINENIRYPQLAVEKGIQGKVFVQFTIDKNGKVGNISILRGVDDSLDWETCRLIHSLPLIKPAKLSGKNIDAYVVFPVTFRLQ